jgi:hypothetical protein
MSTTFNKEFDVCFISLNVLKHDARTLNLARILAKSNLSICIIALAEENEISTYLKENIHLVPVQMPDYKRAYKRILTFSKELKKYFHSVKSKIYCAEDLYSLYPASKMKRINGGKLFYDSREIYSSLGPLFNNPLKQKIISFAEKRLIKYVDEIFCSGELDAEYLQNYFKWKNPIHVIMNLPNYHEHVSADLFRENYPISGNQKIILYQGMLLPGRGILKIIESLEYLNDFVFCLLGDGPFKNEVLEFVKSKNLGNRVYLCGTVPYDELHHWTCSADIGVSFIEPVSFSYELALPNKIFEYCMALIPSLSSDLPALKKVYEKFEIGKIIPSDSTPKAIADAISEIDKHKEKYKEECKKAKSVFHYEAQENMILKLMKV